MPILDITKKEVRNKIYKKALIIYRTSSDLDTDNISTKAGLCFYINEAIICILSDLLNVYAYNDIQNINPYDHMDKYPEIYKHKPDNENHYWFTKDKEGIAKRIAILKEAIKLTK